MAKKQLRVMVIGAHPDDCDFGCGGTAIKFAQQGHVVKFLSVTDGSAGHQSDDRKTLAARRAKEAQNSAKTAGIEYEVLKFPDGELEVNLESRSEVMRKIRRFNPDMIITHRPNDYHPDHRYTSQIVQDSSYLLMVPNVCPDTPAMDHQPIILYMSDSFKLPTPFVPDVIVAVDEVAETKVKMLACHVSQCFEWLPWIDSRQGGLPKDYDASRYPSDFQDKDDSAVAKKYYELLCQRYGEEKARKIKYAEAYQVSEYGGSFDGSIDDYFPY